MIRPPSTGLFAKAGVGKAAPAAPKSEPVPPAAPPVVPPETSAPESADAPSAPDSEEPPASDDDDAPGADIASPEVRAAITAVTVEVTAPIINEDGITYRKGERFQTSPERAAALAHLTALVS